MVHTTKRSRLYRQPARHIQRAGYIASISLLFLLSMWLFSDTTRAASLASRPLSSQPPDTVDFQISPGLNATTRPGYWLPVSITLTNSGKTVFNGRLEVMTYNGSTRNGGTTLASSEQRYQQMVTIPPGQKQVTLYIPFNVLAFSPRGIIVQLFDSHNRLVASHDQGAVARNPGNLSIGVLTDEPANFSILKGIVLPPQGRAIDVEILNAQNLPTLSKVLENFEVIILADFSTAHLQDGQLTALQTWVNQGGVLIEVGGEEWFRTLNPLPPDLLPVTLQGTTELAPGTHLLPGSQISGQPVNATASRKTEKQTQNNQDQGDNLPQYVTASVATLRPQNDNGRPAAFVDEMILASDTLPLLVQARQGQGVICYLAFDPAHEPLAHWSGNRALWQHLLLRTLGDQVLIPANSSRYPGGPGAVMARGGILSTLIPNTGISIWLLILLLIGYIALLGPLRLLVMRLLKRKRTDWNWRILLSAILLFSLLSYWLAFYQKEAALTNNSFSVTQINQSGTAAHTVTYMGVVLPDQSDYTIRLPVGSLVQSVAYPLYETGSATLFGDATAPVTYNPHSTDITLLNNEQWSTHALVSELDQQLRGSLVAHLTLRDGRVVGTITNTLSTSLSDVYVLVPHGIVQVGTLPAGKTQKINLPLRDVPVGTPLVNAIAGSHGLPPSYFPYTHDDQPETATQRHIAQLTALNGVGFNFIPCSGPCAQQAIVNVNKEEIVTPPIGTPKASLSSGYDPLLLDGAPATLIGWADRPLDGTDKTTINDHTPPDLHDNLVQMPLDLTFSSPADVAPDFVAGQLIDATGNNVQMVLPGIYTMTTGSLSFEFTLPTIANAGIKGLIVTAPNTAGFGSPAFHRGLSVLQPRLYNWQSGTWDLFFMDDSHMAVSGPDTYIGPGGRVLLQISNSSTTAATISLARPSLTLMS
ncbi:MAG: hypothetical protein IMW89_15975 [Ktedonobacteraceae bacterium]|nr:hypothetical protein [Ktedonobacteraceae bacterium]